MKILICTFGFFPEKHGVALAAEYLAEGLLSRGHSVTVATGGDFHGLLPASLARLEVHRFRVSGNAHIRSHYRGDIGSYVDFVSRTDADVAILMCWQIWSTDLALDALPRRVRIVLASQGTLLGALGSDWRTRVSRLLWKPYGLWNMPRMLQRVDRLVLATDRLTGARFYDHRVAVAHGTPIEIIPNTVRPQAARGGFRSRCRIETRFMALLIGNFGTIKNQQLAVDAFRLLKRNDVTLVLMGFEQNGYSRYLVRELEGARDVQWRVLFDRDDADIWDAYAECDLALITSRTEYQPLVALQAMSVGKPVVSTDVGCVGDLPGCRVVAEDAQAYAAAIAALLDDASVRERLGASGAAAFRESFEFEVVTERWNRLMDDLVHANNSHSVNVASGLQ